MDWQDAHLCGKPSWAAAYSNSSHACAGTAESAQLFNTDYISRGSHGNLRAEADDVLFRLLTGYLKDQLGHESRLRTLAQKAALLSALKPRDRLRTLGLVRPGAAALPACLLHWPPTLVCPGARKWASHVVRCTVPPRDVQLLSRWWQRRR